MLTAAPAAPPDSPLNGLPPPVEAAPKGEGCEGAEDAAAEPNREGVEVDVVVFEPNSEGAALAEVVGVEPNRPPEGFGVLEEDPNNPPDALPALTPNGLALLPPAEDAPNEKVGVSFFCSAMAAEDVVEEKREVAGQAGDHSYERGGKGGVRSKSARPCSRVARLCACLGARSIGEHRYDGEHPFQDEAPSARASGSWRESRSN